MNRMPDKPETWAWLAVWLQENWPTLYAAAIAFFIAAMRIVYGGGDLRRVALEAPFCGLLALAGSHGLALLGIPTSTAPFFGGVIGLIGVEGTRALALRFFKRKVDSI
jgi:lambda family phage holin